MEVGQGGAKYENIYSQSFNINAFFFNNLSISLAAPGLRFGLRSSVLLVACRILDADVGSSSPTRD